MAKILTILLFLAFVAYGQSTDARRDALRKLDKSYAKCCCSEEAVGDKDCENIFRNVIEPGEQYKMEIKEFQELVKDFPGILILCAVINSQFACGGCGGFTCPGKERDCSVGSVGTSDDDLGDLLNILLDDD